jgi:hypothetical protein
MDKQCKGLLRFNLAESKFYVYGLTIQGALDIVEVAVRSDMSKAPDKSEPIKRDIYSFIIKWDYSDDSVTISHDCGNEGLKTGILSAFLEKDARIMGVSRMGASDKPNTSVYLN